MPRAGLNRAEVVAAGARLADETGPADLTLGTQAEQLGIRTPSLYKHIDGLADLRHHIAALAMTELDTAVRDAMHGLSGAAALRAFALAFRRYATEHPGRYAATVGVSFGGPDDPVHEGAARIVESLTAILRGYGVPPEETVHALRTLRSALHGFSSLQNSDGFRWDEDADESFDWMIRFLDRGLTEIASR